jgi:hypothetical protein
LTPVSSSWSVYCLAQRRAPYTIDARGPFLFCSIFLVASRRLWPHRPGFLEAYSSQWLLSAQTAPAVPAYEQAICSHDRQLADNPHTLRDPSPTRRVLASGCGLSGHQRGCGSVQRSSTPGRGTSSYYALVVGQELSNLSKLTVQVATGMLPHWLTRERPSVSVSAGLLHCHICWCSQRRVGRCKFEWLLSLVSPSAHANPNWS